MAISLELPMQAYINGGIKLESAIYDKQQQGIKNQHHSSTQTSFVLNKNYSSSSSNRAYIDHTEGLGLQALNTQYPVTSEK